MDTAILQQVRTVPLFSSLTDAQLGMHRAGRSDRSAGRNRVGLRRGAIPFFFVVLEGEVRLTRDYDHQKS